MPLICLKVAALVVGVCVYEADLLLRFAYVALLLLSLSFLLGVGVPSLSLGGFMFYAARRGLLFVVAWRLVFWLWRYCGIQRAASSGC